MTIVSWWQHIISFPCWFPLFIQQQQEEHTDTTPPACLHHHLDQHPKSGKINVSFTKLLIFFFLSTCSYSLRKSKYCYYYYFILHNMKTCTCCHNVRHTNMLKNNIAFWLRKGNTGNSWVIIVLFCLKEK